MAAWRSHLKRTNKVVKPCACKRLTLKIWGQILHLDIHLDAGCSPVHASSAQEGDLPKTDPGSKSHKDDAVIGSTHHLVQRQNWTYESTNGHLDSSWGHDEHLHPDVALLADVVPGQEDDRLQLAHDRLGTVQLLREQKRKKGRNIFWSGMAKELWPLWRALTTPELLDQHLASTTLLFCKPHSKRECKDYSSFLRLQILHLCLELPIHPLK